MGRMDSLEAVPLLGDLWKRRDPPVGVQGLYPREEAKKLGYFFRIVLRIERQRTISTF